MLTSTGKLGMALMVAFLLLHSIIFWLAIVAYEINFAGIIKRWLQKDAKTNNKVDLLLTN